MNVATAFRLAVSSLLLVAVIGLVGPGEILGALGAVSSPRLVLVVLLFICTLLLSGVNLWILLQPLGSGIRFTAVIRCSIRGWGAGVFTPGKIGELSTIYLLIRNGAPAIHATTVFLADKVITLLTLVTGACLGVVLLFGFDDGGLIALLLAATPITLGLTAVAVWRLVPSRYRRKPEILGTTLVFLWRDHRLALGGNGLLTLLKWGFTAVAVRVVFEGMGFTTDVIPLTLAVMIIGVLNLIPITLHGLGLKELAAVPVYGALGVPAETAVAASLLLTLTAYLTAASLLLAELLLGLDRAGNG